jgi:hypothetical protein
MMTICKHVQKPEGAIQVRILFDANRKVVIISQWVPLLSSGDLTAVCVSVVYTLFIKIVNYAFYAGSYNMYVCNLFL